MWGQVEEVEAVRKNLFAGPGGASQLPEYYSSVFGKGWPVPLSEAVKLPESIIHGRIFSITVLHRCARRLPKEEEFRVRWRKTRVRMWETAPTKPTSVITPILCKERIALVVSLSKQPQTISGIDGICVCWEMLERTVAETLFHEAFIYMIRPLSISLFCFLIFPFFHFFFFLIGGSFFWLMRSLWTWVIAVSLGLMTINNVLGSLDVTGT